MKNEKENARAARNLFFSLRERADGSCPEACAAADSNRKPTGDIMQSPMKHWFPSLATLCALACSSSACGTHEVQLESMRATLGPEDPRIAALGEAAACLTVINEVGSDVSYEVRLDGRPLEVSGSDDALSVHGGSLSFCVGAGDYNLSLVSQGDTVAQTGTLSMRSGQQLVFIVFGEVSAPTVKAAEVDLTSPGAGLRRIRITNIAPHREPVQLIYYDADDREVARSASVAYADTFTGTIPTTITHWRLNVSQQVTLPIYSSPGSQRPWDAQCFEVPPTGLIIDGALAEGTGTTFVYPFRSEPYVQRPPACTVNLDVCPSCVGW